MIRIIVILTRSDYQISWCVLGAKLSKHDKNHIPRVRLAEYKCSANKVMYL